MNDIISRQAAIDAPVKMVSEGLDWIPVYHIKGLPPAEPEPQWIPCSERLPENEQIVLVTYKTIDRLHVCQYYEDGSRNQWYSLNDMCRAHNNVVLAWMPLPEPYKAERREE